MSWFGIRGIGSIHYLMYAIEHGLPREHAGQFVNVTLTVVAVSVVIQGVSVAPLMGLYRRRTARDEAGGALPPAAGAGTRHTCNPVARRSKA